MKVLSQPESYSKLVLHRFEPFLVTALDIVNSFPLDRSPQIDLLPSHKPPANCRFAIEKIKEVVLDRSHQGTLN